MFMTIFGVCGAVSLLTAGLAVQSSIGQIGNRQFEELIHYDLIVAEESDTDSAQREEIATTLKGKTVQSSTAVRYEELSKKPQARRTISSRSPCWPPTTHTTSTNT